jgi:hypothetical protein
MGAGRGGQPARACTATASACAAASSAAPVGGGGERGAEAEVRYDRIRSKADLMCDGLDYFAVAQQALNGKAPIRLRRQRP